MSDLLPLLAFSAGVVTGFAAVLVRRDARIMRSVAVRLGAVLIGAAMIAAPYVAYLAVAGDPDVWDFYRSAWFVPLVVQGALTAVGAGAGQDRWLDPDGRPRPGGGTRRPRGRSPQCRRRQGCGWSL